MICPSTVIYRLFRQHLNSWASRFCITAMFETEGTDYPKKTEKVQWNSVFRDWNCWPSIFLGGCYIHPDNMNTNHFCRPTWIVLFKVSGCVQLPNFSGETLCRPVELVCSWPMPDIYMDLIDSDLIASCRNAGNSILNWLYTYMLIIASLQCVFWTMSFNVIHLYMLITMILNCRIHTR